MGDFSLLRVNRILDILLGGRAPVWASREKGFRRLRLLESRFPTGLRLRHKMEHAIRYTDAFGTYEKLIRRGGVGGGNKYRAESDGKCACVRGKTKRKRKQIGLKILDLYSDVERANRGRF